jgi:lipopolysaccharide/colanic/teichoic acid biosynthesis glycosyltransferase
VTGRVDRSSIGTDHASTPAIVSPSIAVLDDVTHLFDSVPEVGPSRGAPPSVAEAADVVRVVAEAAFPVSALSVAAIAGRILKRALDIAAGVAGLTIMLALFPVAFLLVSLDSPGPVIYGQRRVGRDTRRRPAGSVPGRRAVDYGGRPFTVFKLRTMRCDAESQGPCLAVEGDPRTTRVGQALRRYHIDEWPQFLCILTGAMSLVGARPERPFFAVKYRRAIPRYRWRTAGIRPGLIGLSQVLVGYDHSMASVRAKAELDARYREAVVRQPCTWLAIDSRVVVQTARYMCGRRPHGDVDSIAITGLIEQHEQRAD